jgi:cystathionine beta-lyase family protein involved in aluminum resistance
MLVICELIFKLSDFTGIKQKKSTKNKKFYLLFMPIIFKNFMKISIFHFYMTIETKTDIYIHKSKVYSMFPSNFIREIKKMVFCGTVIFCGTYTCIFIGTNIGTVNTRVKWGKCFKYWLINWCSIYAVVKSSLYGTMKPALMPWF